MDHFIFTLQQRLEYAQVSFRPYKEAAGFGVTKFRDTLSTQMTNVFTKLQNQEFTLRFNECIHIFKDKYWVNFKIADAYHNFLYFLFTKVTKTHLYFGGLCFLFGAFVGAGIGIKIRKSPMAPQKMRAIVANQYGGLESISIVEDISSPLIYYPDQILIEVKAAAIDHIDIKISDGYGRMYRKCSCKYNSNSWGEFPVVLGRQCSGVVKSVGTEVTRLEPGDHVWLALPFYCQGTLGEFVVVPEYFAALKPTNLSFESAAVLAYDSICAWHLLVHRAGLDEVSMPGKKILVIEGHSSIGSVIIQLAREWGGHVTASVSSNGRRLAEEMGVDDVIVCDVQNLGGELSKRDKFDLIINNCDSEMSSETCALFLSQNGMVLNAAVPSLPSDKYGLLLSLLWSFILTIKCFINPNPLESENFGDVRKSGEVLENVAPLVLTGRLRPLLDKTVPAQDAELAFQRIAEHRGIGKTVVLFDQPSSLPRSLSLTLSD